MASPKLRFKEFDEDWSDSKLGQLIGISSASRVFKEQWQTSGVPFFRTSDVVSISKNKENEKAYISLELFEELSKKSGKIQKGDLLVTGGGTIGIPYLVKNDEPLYFKDADLLWMKSSGIIDGSFLYNFFISPKFREYLKSISHTGTISHFTIEQAKVTPFQYPSKEEQTKIATFLSAVDEKISQLSQKLHLLGQYKQGMMQKLFSQQIRFKADDGSEFGEWESKKLNEIGQSFNGLVGKSKEDFGEGEAYITYKQIFDHRKINLNNINFVNISPNDTQNMVKKGDIFFTTSSETANEVAYCSVILDDFEFPLYLNSFCFGYRPNSAKIFNSAYASFYFRSNIFRNKIKHLAQGSTRFNISKIAFMNVLIHLPMLEEQTKIANFLSTIDQKIDVVSEQLKQAKIWKKGLLQQMFV